MGRKRLVACGLAVALLAIAPAGARAPYQPHHGSYLPFQADLMVVDAAHDRILVSLLDDPTPQIAALDPEGRVVDQVKLPAAATSMVVDGDTLYVLMPVRGANAIDVIDIPSLDEQRRIDLSYELVGRDLVLAQGRLWYADCNYQDFNTDLVSLDPANGLSVEYHLDAGSCPELQVANPSSGTLIAYEDKRRITEIDISGLLPMVSHQLVLDDVTNSGEAPLLPSPDGESLYLGTSDEVRIYDAETLEVVERLHPNPNVDGVYVKSLVVSPDGGQLAVSNYANDTNVVVYDVTNLGRSKRVAYYGGNRNPYTVWEPMAFRPGTKPSNPRLYLLEQYPTIPQTVFVTMESSRMVLRMKRAYKHRGSRYWFRSRASPVFLAHVEPIHRNDQILLSIAYRSHRGWRNLGDQAFSLRDNGRAVIILPTQYTRPGDAFRIRAVWPGDGIHPKDASPYKYVHITP